MPSTGLRVEGASQLRSSLRKAAGDLNDLKDAHKRAADLVADESRSDSPRGETGNLAGSIRSAGTGTAAIIRAGGRSVPYAGPVHFGWAAHHIEPHPFITEAAQRSEPRWTEIYAQGVQDVLNRIKGI